MAKEMTPDEAADLLRSFNFGEVAARTNDSVGPGIVAAMRRQAPYGQTRHQTGRTKVSDRRHLRDTIIGTRHTRVGGSTLLVTTDSEHAGFVLEGTREHEIHPIGVKASDPIGSGGHPLAFFWGKVDDFVASFGWHGSPYGFVRHPGTKANPFNRRAWDIVRAGVVDAFREQVAEGFEKGKL
jgi:hypothetical protein